MRRIWFAPAVGAAESPAPKSRADPGAKDDENEREGDTDWSIWEAVLKYRAGDALVNQIESEEAHMEEPSYRVPKGAVEKATEAGEAATVRIMTTTTIIGDDGGDPGEKKGKRKEPAWATEEDSRVWEH
ncbi:hypothetical protein K466DRAFT_65776 [Polyporus arcularius HHB13444]|uniref:Uncharacterized protein n=1 Tax=Polyporus arcularius HHB13444 TaxID=1314778 RepID=A0A5C3PI96_9APHY|nr:hypothetical protein K466DRAFT_65776 [Polyporus arcularius HHB13444]